MNLTGAGVIFSVTGVETTEALIFFGLAALAVSVASLSVLVFNAAASLARSVISTAVLSA